MANLRALWAGKGPFVRVWVRPRQKEILIMSFLAAYRVLDVDYEDGSGADRFEYDVQTSGSLFGLLVRF